MTNLESRHTAVAEESEQVVLSQMLSEKKTAYEIMTRLDADDFYSTFHRRLFVCTQKTLIEHDTMEIESIISTSKKIPDSEFGELLPHHFSAEYMTPRIAWKMHVDNVVNASLLRKFDATCRALAEKSREPGISYDDVRADMMARLMEAPKKKSSGALLKDVTGEHLTALETARTQKTLPGITYPFRKLNTMTAGMMAGQFILFAGRPSQGKSTVTRTVAVFAASLGIPVDYRSYEDTIDTFLKRTSATLANVPLGVMFDPRKLTDEQLARVKKAYAQIEKLPIIISDNSDLNCDELFFDVYATKMRHNTGLVVQDYLQLLDVPKDRRAKDSRHLEVSYISQSLKRLASTLKIPVIAVSQLGRDVERRKSRLPELQDLRDSGSLEQDADVVGLVFRPGFYFKTASVNDFKIIVAKQRNGPIGTVPIYCDMQIGLLRDVDEELGF
jgi:replicative DNA helicase